MVFGRRKSAVYQDDALRDEESDAGQRTSRRLSKPKTNTSSTNLNNGFKPNVPEKRSSSTIRQDSTEQLAQFRSHARTGSNALTDTDAILGSLKPNKPVSGVAMMVNGFESNFSERNASQTSLEQRPGSRILGAKRDPVKEKVSVNSLEVTAGRTAVSDRISPASSSEQVVDDPAPRPRRTPSFHPGAATRVSPSISLDSEQQESTQTLQRPRPQEHSPRLSVIESVSDWVPPPQNHRPETPQGLDYTHLGAMNLGSLKVTNGRASPAFSEMSKHLVNPVKPRIRREESSQYAPSELGNRTTSGSDWADDTLPSENSDETVNAPLQTRDFSFVSGMEGNSALTEKLRTLSPIVTPTAVNEPPRTPDLTAQLAQSYMDELPKTPYSDKSRSTSPVSVIHHEERAGGERSFISESVASSPAVALEYSPPHPREPPPPLPNAQSPPLMTQDSLISFHSAVEPARSLDEPFVSALELQSTRSRSPLKPASIPHPSHLVQLGAVSDSGYSSKTSLGIDIPYELTKVDSGSTVSSAKKKKRFSLPFRKNAKDPQKGVLVKPASTEKVPQPSSAQIETISTRTVPSRLSTFNDAEPTAVAASLPASPTKSSEKGRKRLIKLRRKSTVEVASALVVQRLVSLDVSDIPAVSHTARDNLAARAELVPELDKTYKSQHHIRSEASMSVLAPAHPPLIPRFPSPVSEDERPARPTRPGLRSRSRSRSRSISRPRLNIRPKSWFGFGKEDKRDDSYTPNILPSSHLDDLGSVIDSLGSNPYDIANGDGTRSSREISSRRVSPSGISNHIPRPRSMMDDEAASNLSKLRRKSWHEKDRSEKKPATFDDRGGIPGTNIHAQAVSEDVPPLPPMPSQHEIARRMSARYSYGINFHNKQHDPEGMYSGPNSLLDLAYSSDPIASDHRTPTYQTPDLPSSPPPIPPSHSQESQYVDNRASFEEEHADLPLDVIEPLSSEPHPAYLHEHQDLHSDEAPAPPPPSHSPRPMDITPSHSPRPLSRSSRSISRTPHSAQAVSSPSAPRTVSYEEDWGVESLAWRNEQHSSQNGYYEQTASDSSWSWNAENASAYPSIPHRRPKSQRNPDSYDSYNSQGHYYAEPSQQHSPELQYHPSHHHNNNRHDTYNGYNGYERQFQHYPVQTPQSSSQPRHHGRPQLQPQLQPQPQPQLQPRIPRRPVPQQRHTVHEDAFYPYEVEYQDVYNHPGYDSAYQRPFEFSDPYATPYQQKQTRTQSASPQRQNKGQYSPNRNFEAYHRPSPSSVSGRSGVYVSPNRSPQQQQTPQHQAQQHYQDHRHHHQSTSYYRTQTEKSYSPQPARPSSRHSNISNRSHRSLAEELHPDHERPSTSRENAPQFGRYSNGYDFLAGSAGSRSVSGKQLASVGRKSFEDRERYGIDLDDVPSMTVPRGAGGRMVYT